MALDVDDLVAGMELVGQIWLSIIYIVGFEIKKKPTLFIQFRKWCVMRWKSGSYWLSQTGKFKKLSKDLQYDTLSGIIFYCNIFMIYSIRKKNHAQYVFTTIGLTIFISPQRFREICRVSLCLSVHLFTFLYKHNSP